MYPAGNGKPYRESAGFWGKDWNLGTCQGTSCSEYPNKKSHTVSLSEQFNGKGEWKSGGSEKGTGAFHDMISLESRTITQRFSVNGKRVRVVLGIDNKGKLIETWDGRYVPAAGYVPDCATAIQVARAVLAPIYGKAKIDAESPWHTGLKNGIWTVVGTFKGKGEGGEAIVQIDEKTAAIKFVGHTM